MWFAWNVILQGSLLSIYQVFCSTWCSHKSNAVGEHLWRMCDNLVTYWSAGGIRAKYTKLYSRFLLAIMNDCIFFPLCKRSGTPRILLPYVHNFMVWFLETPWHTIYGNSSPQLCTNVHVRCSLLSVCCQLRPQYDADCCNCRTWSFSDNNIEYMTLSYSEVE